MTSVPTVQGTEIVDFHLHFRIDRDPATRDLSGGQFTCADPDEQARRRRQDLVAAQSARWRRAWDFPDPQPSDERTWEEEADLWLDELDRHGIAHATFVTGGGDDRVAELVARHPQRFSGMANLRDLTALGAAERLRRAVTELGLRGLKLFAPLLPHRIDDPAAETVWRVAAEYELPVLIHFGHCGSSGGIAHNAHIEPAWLESVAKRHPGIPFVIPHFGVQHVQQVLFLCWACPNVHVDTSGSNQWVRWMPYKLTLEDLFRRCYETIGPDRIVFGSDSSWFPRGYCYRYLADQLRVCHEMGMPDTDLGKIFGGNAARLLRLPRGGHS
ncbi:amidohydrolase 2 [Saccharomonospora azurea SZMC 14600]|uniref:amidohydrolase family protein n=1 Tax=Saccharomonospora azurea TaxID=40988 RepID=UPI00023FF405|nr:amidohydrolase family protein [Saccharomonospora azurea]EHK82314.1 amidohydrolase 2 [Saccharomonospora azurea SZMC 14600]